jgi:hypothetical protein
MITLMIEVTPELEQRLLEEAAKSGQSVADVAFAILQQRLVPPVGGASGPEAIHALFEGLPRRTPADLLELADAQGVKPVERFEDLLGDFWPEEETCDQFLAWLREGRRDQRRESRNPEWIEPPSTRLYEQYPEAGAWRPYG